MGRRYTSTSPKNMIFITWTRFVLDVLPYNAFIIVPLLSSAFWTILKCSASTQLSFGVLFSGDKAIGIYNTRVILLGATPAGYRPWIYRLLEVFTENQSQRAPNSKRSTTTSMARSFLLDSSQDNREKTLFLLLFHSIIMLTRLSCECDNDQPFVKDKTLECVSSSNFGSVHTTILLSCCN